MADVKISALPAATTPVAGTEVLPIVQSSTTKKVAISDLTAGRTMSAAALTLTTTPLGVASGGTGLTSLTAGYIPYGNGTGAFGSTSLFQYANSVLNIGVAPAAWSGMSATQLAGGGAFVSASSYARFGSNIYYDGAWKYISSMEAARYEQAAGAHVWYSAGSGSAGGTISFTQAMTLDASGRLGVNISTPQTLIQTYTSANSLSILNSVRNDQTGTGIAAIGFDVCSTGESSTGSIKAGIGLQRGAAYGGGALCFYNNNSGSAGNFTTADEKMRLTSAGDLLVNTTSSGSGKIVVKNTPTSEWGIDFAQSSVTVANNSNATLPAGSGIIIITDGSQTGCSGMYLVGGGGVSLVSGTTSGGGTTLFVTPTTTPAAGKACIAYDGANYRIYNNQGNSIGFTVAMLRSGNSN